MHDPSRECRSECAIGQSGAGDAGSDHSPEAIPGEDRAVEAHDGQAVDPNSNTPVEPDLDFEFLTEHETINYQREIQRLIRKFEQELGEVSSHEVLFPKRRDRLDVLEVMCSSSSEITNQALHLGGKAFRFGLAEGDLREQENRKKMFRIMIQQQPQYLWYSPICAPWCAWSRFNCQRAIETSDKIMQKRWDNLWQLALAIVLFRFQSLSGRHFHLGQPSGSEMLLVYLVFRRSSNNRPSVVSICVD